MRKYLLLIAIFILLGGCSPSEHLSLGEYDTIPKGTIIYDEEGRVIFTIYENFTKISNGGLEFKGCAKGIDEDIFFGTVEEFKKLAD